MLILALLACGPTATHPGRGPGAGGTADTGASPSAGPLVVTALDVAQNGPTLALRVDLEVSPAVDGPTTVDLLVDGEDLPTVFDLQAGAGAADVRLPDPCAEVGGLVEVDAGDLAASVPVAGSVVELAAPWLVYVAPDAPTVACGSHRALTVAVELAGRYRVFATGPRSDGYWFTDDGGATAASVSAGASWTLDGGEYAFHVKGSRPFALTFEPGL